MPPRPALPRSSLPPARRPRSTSSHPAATAGKMSWCAQMLKITIGLLFIAALASLVTFLVLKYRPRDSDHVHDPRPNIVIVLADDLGWDDVSFHGNDQIPTPNLDAFASHGVILNRHYAGRSCTPSRGALLTGKLPLHIGLEQYLVINGVYGSGLPLEHKLMPEYLRELGYETHLIGKWHLGFYKESLLPTSRGFDSHYGAYSGFGTYFSHMCSEPAFEPLGVPPGYDMHLNGQPDFSAYGQYVTDLYDRRFREIVERRSRGHKPLFIVMSHMAPHGAHPGDLFQLPDAVRNSSDLSHIVNERRTKYAGLVKTLDDSFGKLIEVLASNGILENSVILFSSDNGGPSFKDAMFPTGASNWPFRGQKFTPWEGAIRVASFVWSPRLIEAPYVSDKLYHFADWLPTFYALAGGNMSDLGTIDGLDVWESISVRDTPSPRDRVLLVHDRDGTTDYPGLAAIMGKYKLVSGEWAMYTGNDWYLAGGDGLKAERSTIDLERRRLKSVAHRVLRRYGLTSLNVTENWRREAVVRCSWGEQLRCNGEACEGVMVSPTGGDFVEVDVRPANDDEPTALCDYAHAPCLFDLSADPCETVNVAAQHPDVLRQLLDFANAFEPAEIVTPFDYMDCYDRNSNPAREDPPVWKPWAKQCDNLLGEDCPHKLVWNEGETCPPGGDIQHLPDSVRWSALHR